MNNISKIGLLSAVALLAACSEKDLPYVPLAGQGEEVVFTFKDDPGSRTMYQDDWDATTNQQLYWGNYLPQTQGKDQVKIFCKAASNQIATYNVNEKTENSNVAESLEKTGTAGVQWGQEGTVHNFYAFYPASAAGDAFVNGTDNTIRAQVNSGQSPVTYKAVVANGTTWTDNALVQVNANTTVDTKNATTIYGQPDMSAAIMVAKTEVSGTPDATSQTGYGYPVPLHFNVLADVLDITINGPVTPNTLLDNNSSDPDKARRGYITINSVTVKAKDGKTIISGDFDLDMAEGTASNVSGNTSIQLQTAQVTSNATMRPVLYVRTATDNTNPTADQLDHLRLRAFLIPGQIKNLNELQITLSTDCGEYTQDLGDDAMVSGKIHPIKLGYFKKRGTQFDFSKWMGQLDPNIYISELSLPGTWHTSVEDYQGTGNTDFTTQYNAGIRAFEVHARNATSFTASDDFVLGAAQSSSSTSEPQNNIISDTNPTPVHVSGNTYTRTVTFTKTVTETTSQPVESYRIKLLNNNNSNDLTAALEKLHGIMNPEAFVVAEIGMEGQKACNVPKAVTSTTEKTYTATVTQTGTYTNRRYSWTPVTAPADNAYTLTNTQNKGTSIEYTGTPLSAYEAWVKAVSDLCITLANKGIVYKEQITPNTTISDVAGKIIIKVNTNGVNTNETGWPARTPALFSRWTNGSASTPLNVGLNWGQPAFENLASNPMRWCFTELDNIGSSLEGRKKAVDLMNTESYKNYQLGTHNTWYECMIGGYLGGADTGTAATCQSVAKEMNPYLIQVLSNPNRQACPLGLIFMNYALSDTYSGPELIRAIINNNAAFILARRTGAGNNASDNTNSSFNSNNGNPLK